MKRRSILKGVSSVWMMCALFLFPCILDLERLGCVLFVMANLIAAFLMFKKYNKEKLLKGRLFTKVNIDFPLIWNIEKDTYHIYLGESMEEVWDWD